MTRKLRKDFFLELAKVRIKSMGQEEVKDLIEEYGYEQSDGLSGLAAALEEQYSGVTNGFLSDTFELLFGKEQEFEGEVIDLYKCPCCEHKTLDEVYDPDLGTGYDICPICKWEDDGTTDIDKRSGPNRGSISDYRERMNENPNFYYREKYRKH